jgi:hypothetical protein
LTPARRSPNLKAMDHKKPRSTAAPQNRAHDRKRADALRQNLLKRKQQTRARDEKEKT